MSQKFTDVLHRLNKTIHERKGDDPSTSYTAKLLTEGVERAAKKFGEEAIELVIASAGGDPKAAIAESADLLYHWLVMMAASNIDLEWIADELERREGTSGLVEKASRKQAPE
jgi:phosphoribosyl-ATP pyrophosphohydrolase